MLRRIAEGDSQALADFYGATRSMVFGLALRMLGSPADAEEVALDVYLQVWKAAVTFDATRSPASAWLVLLTRSRALDRMRSAGHRVRQAEQAIEATPDQSLSSSNQRTGARRVADPEEACCNEQRRRRVHAAMQLLSPDQRMVVELAFFFGLTHSELAARLGQPLGTMKTRLRLALRRLRELLETEPRPALNLAPRPSGSSAAVDKIVMVAAP
jgi:RNA polymerase sigma-70 factor (ECF subfamily)